MVSELKVEKMLKTIKRKLSSIKCRNIADRNN
jgi:hypothetical protein